MSLKYGDVERNKAHSKLFGKLDSLHADPSFYPRKSSFLKEKPFEMLGLAAGKISGEGLKEIMEINIRH